MSKTSQAFDATIQRLLPKIGEGSLDETRVLSEAVTRLVAAADQYSLAAAKQGLADELSGAKEMITKQELGEILEAIMCCPQGQIPAYPDPGDEAD